MEIQTSPAWRHVAVLSVLALAACGQKTQNSAENAVNATENAFSNAANATGNAIDNASLALTPTPTPQEFLDKAAESDAFEVAAEASWPRQMAARPRSRNSVETDDRRAHPKSTATDLKKAAGAHQTRSVLTQRSRRTSYPISASSRAPSFDKAYVDGQIEAHEDALSLMRKYAADGTDASLKTAAGTIAPVVHRRISTMPRN